ncbi:MAG: D-glycero-beta-D-manno-heptose-7-phosphate kinase [bacterium]
MPLPIETIEQVLRTVEGKRVAVIGDFMLDRYVWGAVRRISPEAPVPVVEVREDSERPGGAGNVVLNLASLGVECIAVGLVGEDAYGQTLKDLLSASNTDIQGLLSVSGRPTTAKTRIFAEDQQVVRVDRESTTPIEGNLENELVEQVRIAVERADAVILQDYNKGVLTPTVIRTAIGIAQERKIPLAVDPKSDHFFSYLGATVVKPNVREAEIALGRRLVSEKDIERGGKDLLVRLEADMVLITRGALGMSLFTHTNAPHHIPTRARAITDVSGAGDTVIGTLTIGLMAGLNGTDAALLATKAAGYVIGQVGVVPITKEALMAEDGD